jgi:hypothetical protein
MSPAADEYHVTRNLFSEQVTNIVANGKPQAETRPGCLFVDIELLPVVMHALVAPRLHSRRPIRSGRCQAKRSWLPAPASMPVPRSENASAGICESFLPPELIGKQSSGTTLFSYQVTLGGEVRDVRRLVSARAIAIGTPRCSRSILTARDRAGRSRRCDFDRICQPGALVIPQFDTNPEGGRPNCMMLYPPDAGS